jgi:hypothetical protein
LRQVKWRNPRMRQINWDLRQVKWDGTERETILNALIGTAGSGK